MGARARTSPDPVGAAGAASDATMRMRDSFTVKAGSFPMAPPSIVVEGRNCWRRARAGRVAFLVDAAEYYEIVARAMERAERRVLLVAWDVNSRTPMRVRPGGEPLTLGEMIHRALDRNPELRVYILTWDFIVFYAGDRERRGAGLLGPGIHPRLHFRFDACHPKLASHHQKIVVVDDRIAFAGGLDFCAARRDTPAHPPSHPLRVTAKGDLAPPFHDVMMAVDGDAARALGLLCRERWQRATGEALPAVTVAGDAWPHGLEPDLRDVDVAIARTEPAHDGRDEVREIEALNADAIRGAKRSLYVETQYFAAESIERLIADRLAGGVEVVIVVPRESTDWLEACTMGVLRARLMRRLRAADRYGRLRVCFPTVPGIGSSYVKVHSKLLIVDDRFVRIGSSNLCNRSLGVDTECDLAIDAAGRPDVQRAIAAFRARLLGEHLGRPAHAVAAETERRGSLTQAIDELRRPGRTLVELDPPEPTWVESIVPDTALIDPSRPLQLARWAKRLLPEGTRGAVRTSILRAVLALFIAAGLAMAWCWTPLAEAARPEILARLAASIRDHPAAPVLVLAGYVVGTMLVVPVNVLILATALTFGPLASFFYAWVGCVVSGVASYGVGRLLGRDAIDRVGGERVDRLNRRIARQGVLAVATLRLIPVAPFSIVNFVAGASAIGLRDYTLGTALGMIPGILVITLFGGRLANAIERPSFESFAVLAVVSALMIFFALGIERWLRKPEPTGASGA
jgi:phospholipase D1/2